MIGFALMWAAMALTAQGVARINPDPNNGPPDRYLQDDIYDITGQHLCDRRLADRLRHGFDHQYGQRLATLHLDLTNIFGVEAMARDIIRITSCQAFSGETATSRQIRYKDSLKQRAAFAHELVAWEQYAAARKRG